MRSKLISISAAVLGLFVGQAAQADASASVTVNNIKFFVIDMDLTDGETATASFSAITGQSATTWAYANGQSDWGIWGTLPNIASKAYLGAAGASSVVGGGLLDSFALQAEASSASGFAFGQATLSLNFTLSKNAMLVLSADVKSSAQTTRGKTAAGDERGYGGGIIQFTSSDNGSSMGSSGWISSNAFGDLANQVDTDSKMLAGFYNNNGAQFNLVGKLWAEARAESPLTPVPEPETYAMLLAGLGILGLLQRRRRA